MMGTELDPETSAIFNQLTRLILLTLATVEASDQTGRMIFYLTSFRRMEEY
jgi:hypothetical protein